MMEESEIKELVEKISDGKYKVENNDIFRVMVALNNRVKQLYQQTYNPPTNNDNNSKRTNTNTNITRVNAEGECRG